MSDETGERVSVGVATGSAMLAAGVGLANPVAGIIAAGFASMLPFIAEKFYERYARKALQLTEGIEATSELSQEEALTRLLESPEGLDLFQDVLERASSATFNEKVSALGGCLGNVAVADDVTTAAMSERTWVRLIDQLERPHVEAIIALVDTPPNDWDETSYFVACNSAFQEALEPYDALTKQSVRAELQASGLVGVEKEVTVAGRNGRPLPIDGPFWRAKPLAKEVLARLRKHAKAEQPSVNV